MIGDAAKGAIPVLLCRLLDLSSTIQIAGGLASIAGHNWSIFMRFHGGRGIATILGWLLVLVPGEFFLLASFLAVGLVLRNVSLFTIIGISSIPIGSWMWEQDQSLVAGSIIMVFLVIVKRLEANQGLRTPAGKWLQVMGYRLIFDRDVKDKKAWVSRGDLPRQQ